MEEMGTNPTDPPIPPPPAPPLDPPPANGPPHERIANHPMPAAATPSNRVAGVPTSHRPVPSLQTPAREKHADPPHEPKDGTREVIDTIVIVVVLVLLLKSFLAEAFVIPTGSMATTLLGYHKMETCPQCDHKFEVNFSKEADAAEDTNVAITSCRCPNCRLRIELVPRKEEPQQLQQLPP